MSHHCKSMAVKNTWLPRVCGKICQLRLIRTLPGKILAAVLYSQQPIKTEAKVLATLGLPNGRNVQSRSVLHAGSHPSWAFSRIRAKQRVNTVIPQTMNLKIDTGRSKSSTPDVSYSQ